MEVYTEDAAENQAAHSPDKSGEIYPKRKVGVVVTPSAALPSSFFRGKQAAASFVKDDLWFARLAAVGAALR